jgi:PAS domain S-box-containing protein
MKTVSTCTWCLGEPAAGLSQSIEVGDRSDGRFCGTACYTLSVSLSKISPVISWDGLRSGCTVWAGCLLVRAGLLNPWESREHLPCISASHAPSRSRLRTIETAAHLVGIAVEHKKSNKPCATALRFELYLKAPIGISVTSLEGRLVETNRALQEMYGYTGQEFYNLHIVDFTYPDDINPDADLFLNQFVPGKIDHYQLEKRYFRKEGEVFWGRLSMSLARDEQGNPAFAIATTEDITEQKRAQQDLQRAYETLEERVDERTRELSSLLEVSHRLTATLNLDMLLNLILEELKLLIDYHGCALYTIDDDMLVARAYRGEQKFKDLSILRFPVDNPLDRLVFQRRKAVILEDTEEESLEARAFHESNVNIDQAAYEHIRSWMAVPLMVKDQVIGEIAFEHTQPNFFTAQHAGFALAVANQAAVMIENARLRAGTERSCARGTQPAGTRAARFGHPVPLQRHTLCRSSRTLAGWRRSPWCF